MPINAVMLSEEIVFANTAKVNNCRCEEHALSLSNGSDDVAIT